MSTPIVMPQEIAAEDEDRQLLAAIVAGDTEAFQRFYRKYSPVVFSLSRRIIGREHDAEDVVAEVFWELWEKSSRYCPSKSTPATNLIMLTRCRALDRKRGNTRREKPAVLEWLAEDSGLASRVVNQPGDLFTAAEQRQLVTEAVDQLDPSLRQTIELAFFDGQTHMETAESLGIPLGTVKGRIRTAIERLRHALKSCQNG